MTKIKVEDPQLQEKIEHTLFVGNTSSSCGNCGRPTDFKAKSHDEISGWGPSQEGCGIEWKYITSTYVGIGLEDVVRKMRPDLEFFDFMDIYSRGFDE